MARITADLDAWSGGDEVKWLVAQFEVVAELDEPDLSCEFNTLRLYRHKPSGRVWWCQSSGCSCPTPFEEWWFDVEGDTVVATEMSELVEQTFTDFEREVMAFPNNDCGNRPDQDDARKFVAAGKAALEPRP